MAWDTGAAAASIARVGGVSTGAAAKDIKTLYKAIYLKNRVSKLVYQQFAQKQANMDIPLNKGDNVEFTRYAPLSDTPGARAYGLLAEGTTPEPEAYYVQTVTEVVDEYGNFIQPSSRLWLTAFDPKLGGLSTMLGEQSGKSLDLKIQNVLAQGFMGIRADSDTAYQGEIVVGGGSSTTVPVFASLPSSIETGDTGVLVFTSGRCQGITRTFAWASSTSLTVSALPQTPQQYDTARIISTEGLTTGDKITPSIIKKAVALLEENETPKFPDGYYHSIVPTGSVKLDFMNDSEYTNLKHYAAPKDLYRNLIGEFWNVRFHEDSHPYRHTAGTLGTYVASAAPRMVSVFGRDAFGNISLAGKDQNFYINPPESTTTNPLAMFGTMGWKNIYKPLVLNGAWGVNIFCVPTAL